MLVMSNIQGPSFSSTPQWDTNKQVFSDKNVFVKYTEKSLEITLKETGKPLETRQTIRLPDNVSPLLISAMSLQNIKKGQLKGLQDQIKTYSEKIKSGQDFFKKLSNDGLTDEDKTKENASCLLFFLRNEAAKKSKTPFDKGMMTLEDSGSKIFNFLKKCEDSYSRDSSHFSAFQAAQSLFKKALNAFKLDGVHKGLDFNEPNGLPLGAKTALFGRLEDTDGTKRLGKNGLTFIKFEEHGLKAPSDRIRHAMNFVTAILRRVGVVPMNDPLAKKEHISNDLKHFREDLMKELEPLKDNTKLLKSAWATLSDKSLGMRGLDKAIKDIFEDRAHRLENFRVGKNRFLLHNDPIYQQAEKTWLALLEKASGRNIEEKELALTKMQGDEVVLFDKDLK
ncbi:MAG: hypothetical protein A2Y14_04280 [Verrucomicrobia bacterium GWF2_51_19]|nr:MAG: hypothetical protein A2Y14_04280 [Verrucomicrobia bacterium GWF2_51_19]HCJ12230.1 hypothetical protein [Opitutae bacterium]